MDKFRPEWQLKNTNEQKEFSANEGVVKVADRVEEILKNKECVVVTVTGSSNNVGKTHMSNLILSELFNRGVGVCTLTDTISSFAPRFIGGAPEKGRVLLFNAEGMVYDKRNEEEQRKNLEKFHLPTPKVDLRVFLYRPDKPFRDVELKYADIIIRNDAAIDKTHVIK